MAVVNDRLRKETERLRRCWMRHDAARLRDYLVSDVEDPRLNVQSILSRHFVAHAILGDRLGLVQEEEFRFAAVLNWLKRWLQQATGPEDPELPRNSASPKRSWRAEGRRSG